MGLGLGLALGLALGFGLGFGLGSGFGFGCRHAPMAALKQWWEGGTSRGIEWNSSRACFMRPVCEKAWIAAE